ncbi:hypothetical protein PV706_42240 [Streptomyces europaeiscabiei]|uniref:hypothetical protein n=1 Tax=Streptomyces europaeiscabiei TaxID=146819 RepID=UPI0029B3EA3D|nr:hypothetical protein [Streptomyces europaeiscabiei]MDX3876119.1 hypothetical protein [Streptomyces europaeiscabiei]
MPALRCRSCPGRRGQRTAEARGSSPPSGGEYRFVPTSPLLGFSCVSDLDAYRELLAAPASTAAWWFEPIDGHDASSPEVFELVRVAVNGNSQSIRRSVRKEGEVFTVGRGDDVKAEEPVAVSYAYRVLVHQHGHLLQGPGVCPGRPV